MDILRSVRKSKQSKNLVLKLLRDVDSGYFSAPKAFDSLSRYRTEELSYTGPQPLRVDLPEQRLLRTFLQKYPEAKSEPVALDSFRPPLARQFVQHQQRLMMQSGGATTASAAFTETEAVFAEQLQAMRKRHLGSLGGVSPLELLQQQEQEQLEEGLAALEQQRQEAAAARLEATSR